MAFFELHGIECGRDLKRVYVKLAQYAPVPFWLSMTFDELKEWVEVVKNQD